MAGDEWERATGVPGTSVDEWAPKEQKACAHALLLDLIERYRRQKRSAPKEYGGNLRHLLVFRYNARNDRAIRVPEDIPKGLYCAARHHLGNAPDGT